MKKNYFFIFVILLFSHGAYSQAAFSIQGNLCQHKTLYFIDESDVAVSNWSWEFGDGETSIEQNPTHTYTDTGIFMVKLTIVTSNSNSYSDSMPKHISANPIVGFITDSTQIYYSTYSRTFIDTSKLYNPVKNYIWNFGDGSAPILTDSAKTLYKYAKSGSYQVWLKVVDNEGCTDSVSNIVDIHDRFYIPNVFTPNGDEMNEEFIVTSNGNTLFSIEIYSRWGNIVFKRSGHQQIVWDGHMPNGSIVQPGTYYYVIYSESDNVTYEPEKGFITVFR